MVYWRGIHKIARVEKPVCLIGAAWIPFSLHKIAFHFPVIENIDGPKAT
jgi:hypothetical protein